MNEKSNNTIQIEISNINQHITTVLYLFYFLCKRYNGIQGNKLRIEI